MAKCGTCGADSTRVRSRWNEERQLPDECPQCAPESFEKFTAPSDKKIWMGWEAHPNEYVKVHPEDGGVAYERKREYRAEQEQRLSMPSLEDMENQERAEGKKRAERRTAPMDSSEHLAAITKARRIAEFLYQSAQEGIDVRN